MNFLNQCLNSRTILITFVINDFVKPFENHCCWSQCHEREPNCNFLLLCLIKCLDRNLGFIQNVSLNGYVCDVCSEDLCGTLSNWTSCLWHSFKAEGMSAHILVCENLFMLMGLNLLCLYRCLTSSANNLGVSLHCAHG